MQTRINAKPFRLTAAGLAFTASLIAGAASLSAGAALADTKPNIGHFTLANGLEVVVVPDLSLIHI